MSGLVQAILATDTQGLSSAEIVVVPLYAKKENGVINL